MDFDDNEEDQDGTTSSEETGSDELLSDDTLRLPEHASILVRIHAVRAWLTRRQHETTIEIGEVALALQQTALTEPSTIRVRRSERQHHEEHMRYLEQALAAQQERLRAYEEAQSLLEECIAHTSGERVLVEYYLALEDLMQSENPNMERQNTPRHQAFADVQHRVEHVGAPNEEE